MIKVYITDETGRINDNLNKLIENAVAECVKHENYGKSGEVSILVTNSEEVRALNRRFRNIDKETDVLSFPMLDFSDNSSLGDIVVNIEQAEQQALDYGHSFERELAFLITHSMLHLFDYDHQNEEDEKLMLAKQEKILSSLGLVR